MERAWARLEGMLGSRVAWVERGFDVLDRLRKSLERNCLPELTRVYVDLDMEACRKLFCQFVPGSSASLKIVILRRTSFRNQPHRFPKGDVEK